MNMLYRLIKVLLGFIVYFVISVMGGALIGVCMFISLMYQLITDFTTNREDNKNGN